MGILHVGIGDKMRGCEGNRRGRENQEKKMRDIRIQEGLLDIDKENG